MGSHPSVLMVVLSVLLLSRDCVRSDDQSDPEELDLGLCTRACLCLTPERLVDCTDTDSLPRLPTVLPRNVTLLSIQNGRFHGPAQNLARSNMSHLASLHKLKVIRSGLSRIESQSFLDMHHLKELDLSFNDISTLQPHTFDGLQLNMLRLDNNPLKRLLPRSLSGLKVAHISVRNGGLQSLDWEIWKSVFGLRQLDLYNNSIRMLSPEFRSMFPVSVDFSENSAIQNPVGEMLDLSLNPLHCSCQLAWYVAFLRARLPSASTAARFAASSRQTGFSDQSIRCASPGALQGTVLTYLREVQLGCVPPRVAEITLDLGSLTLRESGENIGWPQLHCTAVASLEAPKVEVVALRLNNNNSTTSTTLVTTTDSGKLQDMDSSRKSGTGSRENGMYFTRGVVNVSSSSDQISYLCVASGASWEQIQENSRSQPQESVRIVLSGLSQVFQEAWSGSTSTNEPSEAFKEVSFYQRKQFTLFQLALCVICTLLGTVFALCLTCRLRRVCPGGSPHLKMSSPGRGRHRRHHQVPQAGGYGVSPLTGAPSTSSKSSLYSAVKTAVSPLNCSSTSYPLSRWDPGSGGAPLTSTESGTAEYDTPHSMAAMTCSPPSRLQQLNHRPATLLTNSVSSTPYHLDFKTQEKFFFVPNPPPGPPPPLPPPPPPTGDIFVNTYPHLRTS